MLEKKVKSQEEAMLINSKFPTMPSVIKYFIRLEIVLQQVKQLFIRVYFHR